MFIQLPKIVLKRNLSYTFFSIPFILVKQICLCICEKASISSMRVYFSGIKTEVRIFNQNI